jgi:hypothetical protein
VDVTILRTPGMFFQEQPDGRVSNVYDVKLLNKTFEAVPVRFRLIGIPGDIQVIGDSLTPGPQSVREGKLLITLYRENLHGMSTPLLIDASFGGTSSHSISTTFLGPGRKQ